MGLSTSSSKKRDPNKPPVEALLTLSGKWSRYKHSWLVNGYDVRKTESLITPYVGIIEFSELTEVGLNDKSDEPDDIVFKTEEDARNATTMKPEHGRNRTAKYIWQDGRWSLSSDSGYTWYPITDKYYLKDSYSSIVRYISGPN